MENSTFNILILWEGYNSMNGRSLSYSRHSFNQIYYDLAVIRFSVYTILFCQIK